MYEVSVLSYGLLYNACLAWIHPDLSENSPADVKDLPHQSFSDGSGKLFAKRDRFIRNGEYHGAIFSVKAGEKKFRLNRPDLFRRQINDRNDKSPKEFFFE